MEDKKIAYLKNRLEQALQDDSARRCKQLLSGIERFT